MVFVSSSVAMLRGYFFCMPIEKIVYYTLKVLFVRGRIATPLI
jgi:hypothetical protein